LQSIDWEHAKVGLFGQVVAVERKLSAGDRLEIYRPLAMDPKDSRRARAKRR
jgi:putative ubiquitin-RnfH superfamily antitoxin RatB of RatAB toxin-antitoxin module